ncbi:MAG: D-2-hydroxyacid dehydrogenase [Gammaproteobacteria bacterium]|nr:D-2-hydroxyacid dehydrogenase [Gammaproteobacteria bacterium]
MKFVRRNLLPLMAASLLIFNGSQAGAGPADADTTRLIAELGLKESATGLADRPGWKMPRKVVVIGADAGRQAWLQSAAPGLTVVVARDRAEALREVADADAVIGGCATDLLAAGPHLRWTQHFSAGVERCVSIPGFASRGIVLTNMQKVAGSVMSEHVLALMFGLSRGLSTYIPSQASGEWAEDAVPESRMWMLGGKTLFIAGLGGIGMEVARRAHALGMIVIATRNTPSAKPPFVSEQGLSGDLLSFVARADVIVDALPLTSETKGVFGRKAFDAAKRGALFINVGRGGTVVTAELLAALKDGRIGGAGLDVTDPEPLPPGHPLWHAPNVLITPHVAAVTDLGEELRWLIARENLRRYAVGGKLLSEVSVDKGY